VRPSHRNLPPLGLGLASTVLGAVGLLLFVLPILAIPISVCGLMAGAIGAAWAVARRSLDWRLSLAGAVLCGLAMTIGLAIAYAPGGYFGRPAEPSTISPALPRPYIPPPAPFHGNSAQAWARGIV